MVLLDGGPKTLVHLSLYWLRNVGVLTDAVGRDAPVRIMSLLLHFLEIDIKVLPKLVVELELLHIDMVRPVDLILPLESNVLD